MLLLISLVIVFFVTVVWFFNRNSALKSELNLINKEKDYVLNARDSLLRSVNHELRAPLTRMKLDLEFLDDSDTKNSLDEDISYMQELIEELMEIEKIKAESRPKSSVDLSKLINDVIDKLKIDHDCLVTNISDDILTNGYQEQLEKLLKNLIENAFKYKEADGKVVIKAVQDEFKATITIMNEGRHIPSEDLPFIFEPFFQVDKARDHNKGGFGLGLNICKEIIDSHQGKIQVTSKRDMGTIFKLSLNN